MCFFYLELELTRGNGVRWGESSAGQGRAFGAWSSGRGRASTASSDGGARVELRQRRTAARGMVDGEPGSEESV
jgi:hypothetical protein